MWGKLTQQDKYGIILYAVITESIFLKTVP